MLARTSRSFRSCNSLNNVPRRSVQSATTLVNADISGQELKPWTEIPGPPALPIIGQLHHFLPRYGKLSELNNLELHDHFYKNYGPIVKMLGTFGAKPNVFLFDPDAVSQVLRGENVMPVRPALPSLEYYRKVYSRKQGEPDRPSGLVTDQGENWRSLRTKTNPIMLQVKTIKLYTSALDEVALDMVKRIKTLRDDKNMITDIVGEMNLWSLESICVIAFGVRVGCFDNSLPEDSPAKQLIKVTPEIFKVFKNLDFKPNLWRIFPTKEFKQAMKVYELQNKLAQHFIRRGMKELEVNKSKTGEQEKEKGVLEKLMEIDEHTAVTTASDLLLGGVDTSTNSILYLLYHLAVHQDKQHKLREELFSGTEKKLYLKACLKESMRLMPVTSTNMRETTKEYNLLGYHIPKGINITFGHHYMATFENQFPRPLEYIPERWLVGKDDPLYYGNSHTFAMPMPFGFGVRMCSGRRIAELELEVSVARLLQNFKVEWDGPPPTTKSVLINYLEGPHYFTFKDL